MDELIVYFNNGALRILANAEDLLKSESRFLIVKNSDKKDVLINLDQVLWISKENDEFNDY